MSVIFRPDRNKWQATVWIRGQRKRPLFETKREAEEFDRDCRIGRLGLKSLGKAITIGDAFASYFADLSRGKSRSSRANDKWYFNLAHHFFTVERRIEMLDEIVLPDLEAFQRWLAKEQKLGDECKKAWSNTTINRCFHTLEHFFNKQCAWGNLQSNPAQFLKTLPETPVRRRAMTHDEFVSVIDHAPEWFRPVIRFMRATGARPSSIERLTWAEVDLSNRRLLLTSKKGAAANLKPIVIPLVGETFQILIRERNTRPFASQRDHVFLNEFGRPLSADRISKMGNRAIKKAKLEGLVLYGLRHSLGTDLTEAGVPTEIVRQALGHANIRTTQNYAQGISLDVVAEAIGKVRGENSATNCHQDNDESVALGGSEKF